MYLLVLRLVCHFVYFIAIGSQPFLISIASCLSVLSCCLASPLRGLPMRHDIPDIPINHHSTLPLYSQLSSVLFHLSKMDSSSRNRMPAPSHQLSSRHPTPEQTSAITIPPVSEIGGRVDQLALVKQTLQNGATPTMIAGFAMIIAQIQLQATHPDVLLTITSSIGSLERFASFRDGTWHEYDLTHDLIDPRAHLVFGEPTRLPRDQELSLRIPPQPSNLPAMAPFPN